MGSPAFAGEQLLRMHRLDAWNPETSLLQNHECPWLFVN